MLTRGTSGRDDHIRSRGWIFHARRRRRICSSVSRKPLRRARVLHFATSPTSRANCFREGIEPDGATLQHHHHRRRSRAAGTFPFKLSDLGSITRRDLRKWLLAPLGPGLLYVRRDHRSTWPLQPRPSRRQGRPGSKKSGRARRRRRRLSTNPWRSSRPSESSAKTARLRYLTLRWQRAQEIRGSSSTEPEAGHLRCGGRRSTASIRTLVPYLWTSTGRDHDGRPRKHQDTEPLLRGLRVTPVSTRRSRIDAFVGAIRGVLRNRLPA